MKTLINRFSRFFSVSERIVDLFCPPQCIICGTLPEWARDELSKGKNVGDRLVLCAECRKKIVLDEQWQCTRCGGPLTNPCPFTAGCGNCRRENFCFSSTIALGVYRNPLSRQILSMKRERYGVLAFNLTQLLCRERSARLQALRADMVVPVPMHPLRRFLRGTNSAEQIARQIASFLHLPCRTRLLGRSRWTLRQATLSGTLRRTNLLGAFKLRGNATDIIRGKKIILADDVMTTGSTCNEAARILLKGGAASVTPVVLARAETTEGIPIPKASLETEANDGEG